LPIPKEKKKLRKATPPQTAKVGEVVRAVLELA
jgi:hypothetical protein